MYPADIRSLTGLRFIAAAWVLIYHFRNHLGLDLGRFDLIAKGYLGVDLFFILSGFILSHVYLKTWEERRFNYGSFLWARLARLYPVHLATLAGTVALWLSGRWLGASFDPVAFDPKVLPQHLLLVHAWWTTPTAQWNFPSWSISAEWFAYLAFPIVAAASVALRRRPATAVLLAAGLFLALDMAVETTGGSLTRMSARGGALRIIPSFLMGAALHRLGSTFTLPIPAARFGVLMTVAWIALCAGLGLADRWVWPGLAGLIFCLAEAEKSGTRSALATPLAVYLGEISYAIYMTHLPVDIGYFELADRLLLNVVGGGTWLVWWGALATCLGVSVIIHLAVERPARSWLRRRDPFSRPTWRRE